MRPTQAASTSQDTLKFICEIIAASLESARRQVHEEIRHYPPPIPGCDADFNSLLAARARIGDELNRLRQTMSDNIAPEESMTTIEEFARSSNYITDEAKREIWFRLKELGLKRGAGELMHGRSLRDA